MPPAKSRVAQDDSSNTVKEKHGTTSHGAGGRGRRTGANTMTNGSSLKEVMNSNADVGTGTNTGGSHGTQAGSSSLSWPSEDPALLHTYRNVYKLDTPSAFKNPLSHVLLNQGIGKYSPTMLRHKSKRRVHKDVLALAVRKNFNALAVNETEVIVDYLYKAKNKDKSFRARFAPPKK